METMGDKINNLLMLKPNTREYRNMKDTLTDEEKISLKKELRKRSDKNYLEKKKHLINFKEGNLVDEVRRIKDLLNELVISVKSKIKKVNVFEITESTTVNSSASSSVAESDIMENVISK